MAKNILYLLVVFTSNQVSKMTDTNSNFLLFTIETGWSVKIADGKPILTNDTGASIIFHEDHAILEEPLKHVEGGDYYSNLIAKFSKIYDINWFVDESRLRIEWDNPSCNRDCTTFVIFQPPSYDQNTYTTYDRT